ncbi:hypothetical protein GGTG_03365 [Gaeumannomyces tritici R3-111a-1]|uniref:Uncharacterized protein n=1 Tax=Gaeumannomyces tritici (strain R3-111a-1) TaxID=644352 RepID=J3NQ07_GAET3|nr:hypothetical protein GGTG_03365 [Gaeumannomyces tritici R3-111a-1]EJT78263.1 hypothetical protein GGTG_03365 [Gaeumannomyces tritici R3-111a-1]
MPDPALEAHAKDDRWQKRMSLCSHCQTAALWASLPLAEGAASPLRAERPGFMRGRAAGLAIHHHQLYDGSPLREGHATGEIDQGVYLVESIVSVQNNGKWVADINVLGLEQQPPDPFADSCGCGSDPPSAIPESAAEPKLEGIVSLDSRAEMLDPPSCTGVLRA